MIEVDESGFGLDEGQDGGAEGGAIGGGEQGGAGVEMESRGDGAIGIGGEAAGVGGGAEFLGGVLGEFAEAEAGGGRDAVAPFGGEGLVEFVGRGAGGVGRLGFGAEDFGEGVGELHLANGGDGDGGIGDGAAGIGEFEAEFEGSVEVGGRGEFVLVEFGVEVGFAGVVFEGFTEFFRVGGGVGFAEADGGVGAEGSGFDDAGFALGGEDDFAGFDGEIIAGEEGGGAEEGGGGGVGDEGEAVAVGGGEGAGGGVGGGGVDPEGGCAGDVDDGVIEAAEAGVGGVDIEAGAGGEEGDMGVDIAGAEHGDEEGGFVFAIAVVAFENVGGGGGDEGGFADFEAGVADLAVEGGEGGAEDFVAGGVGRDGGEEGGDVGGADLGIDLGGVVGGDGLPVFAGGDFEAGAGAVVGGEKGLGGGRGGESGLFDVVSYYAGGFGAAGGGIGE